MEHTIKRVLLTATLGLMVTEVLASTDITVQSVIANPGQTDVSVAVLIRNDTPLYGLVLPLQFEAITPGSYLSTNPQLTIHGRFLEFADPAYSGIRRYPSKSWHVSDGACASSDSGGTVWAVAGSSFDGASPDAVLIYTIAAQDAQFPVGQDSLFLPGDQSVLITFGVTDAVGTFVIDTACIAPFNHLAAVDLALNRVAPSFAKGIVEIGGPFLAADSISGHIESDVIISGEVRITGDLIVDAGVKLSVLRGSRLLVTGTSDDQHDGADSGKVEIIVNGTLAIDNLNGVRPVFQSELDSLGAWYGIRIMPGGRFETGIGAVIEDAVVGVTIVSETSADTLSGLTIQNCDSIGIWNSSSSVALINDTIIGPTTSIGVYLDSAGPLVAGCQIDSCSTGIRTRHSWSTIRDSRVVGPGVIGVHIDNEGGLILEGKQRGPRVPAQVAALGASRLITLKCDTVEGYFSQSQLWMEMYSNSCVVDSCGFIHPVGTSRSLHGLYLGKNDTVTVRRSSITGFGSYGVYSSLAKVDLGKSSTTLGNNSIYSDTTGCGACLLKRVHHVGTDTLKAEGNWWGASPPLSTWFSAKVDYNPYSTEPLGKLSTENVEGEIVSTIPREHHLAQNYPNPFNSSTEIEFALASQAKVKVEVYNILGQCLKTLVNREFPEGTHYVTWDATTSDGRQAASGVYLYRIVADNFVQSKKMVLLK